MNYSTVREVDPVIADALESEVDRQRNSLQMIASENHVSTAVLEAQSSVLTNKYAEGYPGRRYYGGCEFADVIEQLAIDRAKELWEADHVNVQPHSGTQANQGVYFAMLEPGDRILSLDLNHGGHLSHGHPANFAGQIYTVDQYVVDSVTGTIDFDIVEEKARSFEPDIIVSGYSAYPRSIDWQHFQDIAEDVGAFHLADIAHITGLVAAGAHPSPVGIADFVTGSTHKTIRAGRGGIIMTDEQYASDIDKAVFPGGQGGPLMHNIAGKAVGFGEALKPSFTIYAEQVVENAKVLGSTLADAGFKLVSDGTDTHLVLVDLRESHPDISGGDAESALESVGIVLNANTVPGETRSPFDPSGIRAGTPALTSRGFTADDMEIVGECIARIIDNLDDSTVYKEVATIIDDLCIANPLYEE